MKFDSKVKEILNESAESAAPMTETEIIYAWNEYAEVSNYSSTIFDRYEFEDYLDNMEAEELKKILLNTKNFSSNSRYFFMDDLGFWRSFNSVYEDISPIDMDELKEYLENK